MNTFAHEVFLLVLVLGVMPVRSASFQTNSIEGWTTLVLSNPMEYFAEATEAFFSRNDFFPFNRAELKRHDTGMEHLLAKLWGVKD